MKVDRGFAGELIQLALDRGADEAEAFVRSSKDLSIEIKDQQIDALESSLTVGYSLRVIKDKRLGFSYSTDREAAVSVVEKSVEAARWVDRDEYLELPWPSDSGNVEIFDPGIISTSEEEAVKKVSLLEKAAYGEDKRIRNIRKARGTFRNSDIIIINSKGVDRQYSSTTCTAQIMAMAENGQDSQMGWYFMGSRFLNEVSFEDVGKYAAIRAIQLLGSKRMNAQKSPVVLDNSVAVEFMGIFASSLSSESVQKGKSLLSGKKGKKVISPKINMVDNGLIPGRLGSRPVDDEGVPSQDKTLIKEGVLSGYLYNTYTAKKEGVLSTGNAVRSSFAGLPSVGLSNLYIDAASKSDVLHIGDIFKAVDKCLYVTEAMGVHTANPISGEFSVGVSGLWVEKGEIAFPVKEAVISGNILSFFENIEAVGDDLVFFGNVGSPSLLFGPTDISA
jgi:PmbA protein